MRRLTRDATITAAIIGLTLALGSTSATAGCGCAKPPPPPAAVRPGVASAGAAVSLFGTFLQIGTPYDVTFTSGTSGERVTLRATAVARRDLADGVSKPVLPVAVPDLPLGPTAITVAAASTGTTLLEIPDAAFTVAPTPLAIPNAYATHDWPGQQAAVGRDGTVYLALDVTDVQGAMVFDAQMRGYPLRFAAADVTFYNVQGFLMQRLVTGVVEPIPGMDVFPAVQATVDSDRLHYSRHEFVTYFLQHQERQPHAVDATDPDWHLDGTRHIDHDHLIVAIKGRMHTGALPAPGATPPLTLRVVTRSLFSEGLVGVAAITTSSDVLVDSFAVATPAGTGGSAGTSAAGGEAMLAGEAMLVPDDGDNLALVESSDGATVTRWDDYNVKSTSSTFDPAAFTFGSQGDMLTNGTLSLGSRSIVDGSATAASFRLATGAIITGARNAITTPVRFMEVMVPQGLTDLGAVLVGAGASRRIAGPGSFKMRSLGIARNAILYVDNTAGPVTVYVTGPVTLSSGGRVTTADLNPEKLAIYVATSDRVSLGVDSSFYGVVYAPTSPVVLSGSGEFFGAFLGATVSLGSGSHVHYDEQLR